MCENFKSKTRPHRTSRDFCSFSVCVLMFDVFKTAKMIDGRDTNCAFSVDPQIITPRQFRSGKHCACYSSVDAIFVICMILGFTHVRWSREKKNKNKYIYIKKTIQFYIKNNTFTLLRDPLN